VGAGGGGRGGGGGGGGGRDWEEAMQRRTRTTGPMGIPTQQGWSALSAPGEEAGQTRPVREWMERRGGSERTATVGREGAFARGL